FARLAARGHRRRRTTTFTAIGASAVMVAVIVAGAHTLTEDNSAPTRPAQTATAPTKSVPTTSPGPPNHRSNAALIVLDPKARLDEFAISRDDPEVRASTWSLQ